MSKRVLRIVSFFVIALVLFPQVALAAPTQPISKDTIFEPSDNSFIISGTPLGEKQTEYPVHTFTTGSFPGRIVSVSTYPTKSGNTVYPNLEVRVMGTAYVCATVQLQKWVNGQWQPVSTLVNGQLINMVYRFNPGFPAEYYCTYRFTFTISSDGGGSDYYYMVGQSFTLN